MYLLLYWPAGLAVCVGVDVSGLVLALCGVGFPVAWLNALARFLLVRSAALRRQHNVNTYLLLNSFDWCCVVGAMGGCTLTHGAALSSG